MDRADLLAFLRRYRWAIEATSAPDQAPQAAIIGYAVTDRLELVFDTLASSRKAANLRANPRIALVIGGWSGEPRTVQYEGLADFPSGAALEPLQRVYFETFPDGPARLAWPGITYVRVTPLWLRSSDFTVEPPRIAEHRFEAPERPVTLERFATASLAAAPSEVAPDGSGVRPLLRLRGASLAHFELPAGRTSRAVRHRTVDEIWYITAGAGQLWRQLGEQEEIVQLATGSCLTIPCGTAFQFRASGTQPLAAVTTTMPPWPGAGEALFVSGPWQADAG
jgi:mannose-6-phosphate isomerase-like protein (cupin superfamily)